jgi:sugar O-acyltransferase (sialic acid O-acetyltransferase NeuD family)
MRVLILGAGGHAQVVADILLRMQEADRAIIPIGYLDDNPALLMQHLLDLPVLGEIAQLPAIPHDGVVVGIGDNGTRHRLFETLRSQGERFVIARHPSAVVARHTQVGPGSVVCAGVVVNPGSVIGANVILNTGCTVDHHNHIGSHVHIAPGVHLGGDVTIGEGTLVGIGATVVPQRRVGKWSVVSAGALVHKNLPDRVVAAGMPARVIRNLASEN